ncbi:MAG: pseudouridine synthase [Candidatus Margulisiibacteriota bacterium]
MRYVIFNKPYGVLCQFTDQLGRRTLKDFIPLPGIYAVGRLDHDSEGLLFLTDDGPLNHRLADPKHKQPKTYWAQVEGTPTEEQRKKLENGVTIGGRRTRPAKVRLIAEPSGLWPRSKPVRFRKTVPTAWLEIVISEGMNRQVRKMTAAVGLPCLRLIRTAIGPIGLGALPPGEYAEIAEPVIR